MPSGNDKLSKIIDLGFEIANVRDLDILLEKILTVARSVVNAEAGSIYIREGSRLRFSYTQNEQLRKNLPAGKKLIYNTFSIPINNDSIAGFVAGNGQILNIADCYKIEGSAPFCFESEYDRISGYRTQSMLAFPLVTNRGDILGVLQLINARTARGTVTRFKKQDEPFIRHFAHSAALAIEKAQLTRAIILRVIKMAELRDPKETGPHVNRVASYAVAIYEAWASKRGISSSEMERNRDILRMGAMLHDVGKVAISDLILKKPARLDPEEFEIMKQHTFLGARLFAEQFSDFDEAAWVIALNHHERWDGNGYPGHLNPVTGKPIPGYENAQGTAIGKKGDEIPPFGRIVAIADVYDALCSKRVYKEPWDESRVLETLRDESGRQFDPEMVESFFSIIDEIQSIMKRYPES